jgi:hypothetical protein
MGVPRIDYENTKVRIAAHLYNSIVNDGPLYCDAADLSNWTGAGKNVVKICLDQLEAQKLVIEGQKRVEIRGTFAITRDKPDFEFVGTGSFTLTAKGREYVESFADHVYDSIIQPSGDEDDWAPLEIERPDQEAEKAATAIESLSEKIRSDNGYAATEPAEREEILRRLSDAADWLRKAEYLTASAVQVYVVWPFETLISRFPVKTAIGSATKVAGTIVMAWLKARGIKILDGLFQ